MLYQARNEKMTLGDTDMDHIVFGSGSQPLIIIPGVGDGIRTVKGTALAFAARYKQFAGAFRVYVFSRKNRLQAGCSTRDMARDIREAMDKLGLVRAHIVGVSQGGMIAQYLAIDYPEYVDKLVLAVTLARQNDIVQRVISSWIEMAEAGDFKSLFMDTAEKSYSEKYLKKYRRLYPLLTRLGKPKDMGRFIIQAQSCLGHDCYSLLGGIACPTLVIGGAEDKIVGPDSAAELAAAISHSRLVVYAEFGHGLYDEAKDFNQLVLDFLTGPE